MKINKKLFLKLIIIFCLIGICFTPIIYAGDAYILKESNTNVNVDLSPGYTIYDDWNYLYIPFTSKGESVVDGKTISYEEAKIGDVTITATTEPNLIGLPKTTYSATLSDGTNVSDVKVTFTSKDGTVFDVSIPLTDGEWNNTSDIKLLLDYPVPDDAVMTVSYTDEAGNEQTIDMGNAGEAVETVDRSFANTLGKKNPELLSPGEMLAGLFNGVANAINSLIAWPVGYQITIDDIVFNQYPETKIDYFTGLKDSGNYSKIIWGTDGNGNGGLSHTVNECYSFFNKIAILVYMVMLVYMGLRIILSSTGQSLSHYKTLFMYWVLGVAILFLYPYAMKYIIQINDTFVTMVSSNKGDSYVVPDRNTIQAATTESIWKVDFDKNPFNGSGTDYMSMIANDAIETKNLALSFAYLILTWQLITLVLHYYKRLFMVGFLIAIFPLVAMFYSIDKIADGKSQAFDHWNKEFMLNVLIQSFHAVVYVFVCGSIGATKAQTGVFDYILIITGTTFLFTGEQIVKGIFSQDSGVKAGAAKGLADTAAWSMAKVQMATNFAGKATQNLIGRDSAIMRLRNAHNVRKATGAKLALFDQMSTTTAAPNAGLRFKSTQQAMSSIDKNTSMTDEQKQASKAETLKLANAVADINNPHTRSVEELQRAYDTVRQAMQNDPNNAILGDLKLSATQLGAVDAVGREVANMVANHVTDPVEIQSKVTATLGYTLEGLSNEEKEKYINMALYQVAQHGAVRYDDPQGSAEDEIDRGARALTRAFSTFSYHSTGKPLDENQEKKRAQVQQAAEEWARSFYEDESEVTDAEKELAEGLFIISNRKSGLYTAEEYLSATEKISRNLNHDSDAAREMAKELGDMDIDLLRHGIARKAKAEGNTSNEVENVIKEYEEDIRDGVYDDEISGHELIALINETDSVAREHKKQKMINDVSTARMKANEHEREETKAIAAEILMNKKVDVNEGGIDTTTRFLNGQTREDILKERRAASFGVVLATAGLEGKGKYSERYKENMKNYQQHFRGDQEGDYTYGQATGAPDGSDE